MTTIGTYSFEEFLDIVASFHGFKAPGVVLGGFMVDLAIKQIPPNILFEAISETPCCLPDAVQLLTPCTTGNGWLRVMNLGRYAVSLYDKYTGKGVRVFIDSEKIKVWAEIRNWLFKFKPKQEQDSPLLMSQIREAGAGICGFQSIQIQPNLLGKHHKNGVSECPICGEAFPSEHGRICRGCQGGNPYLVTDPVNALDAPRLEILPVEQAIGKELLHDITEIIPGEKKGPAFRKGQTISAGDLCRLHQMGKYHLFSPQSLGSEWIHENDAAQAFAQAMSGGGVTFKGPPKEGKINLTAEREGLLVINDQQLEMFNLIPGVMCACRQNHSIIAQGRPFAGTRAIPLYLARQAFEKALAILGNAPLFHILPLKKLKIGILVTGTEVFRGLIQDRFIPIIRAKVEKLGSEVLHSLIVPDSQKAIADGIREILYTGAELLVTTAGLSVDPEDVTRQGLTDAGAEDVIYGTPILPGAMSLLAHIGNVKVIGVPACALYFKTTAFDLLLPRLLAGLEITRHDLAKMGHGGFCLNCDTCTFPKCPFGK